MYVILNEISVIVINLGVTLLFQRMIKNILFPKFKALKKSLIIRHRDCESDANLDITVWHKDSHLNVGKSIIGGIV